MTVMDKRTHQERHQMLHGYLDELLADYLGATRGSIYDNIYQLLTWSHKQAQAIDHPVRPFRDAEVIPND